jgi:hypothetical protein
MQINYLAVVIASVLEFAVGAVWYSALFGKAWQKIHHATWPDSKEEQAKLMKDMPVMYTIQFLVTLITTFVLALFILGLPSEWNVYGIAGFFWIGFVVPTQVSAVIFGGTEKKWMVKKILIMAGASLACLEVAACVLHFFG